MAKQMHNQSSLPLARPQYNCSPFTRPQYNYSLLQDHSATVFPLQDHTTMHSTGDLKNMFPDSFDDMGKYSITLNHNVPPIQERKCRVPKKAKEEIKSQLKQMTIQDIIMPQVEPTPCASSLIHFETSYGTFRVCLITKDLNKAFIHEHHKATML